MSHERSGATLAPRARDPAPAAAFPCPSRILGSRSFLYRVDLGLDGRGLPSVVETRARHAASGVSLSSLQGDEQAEPQRGLPI
jgi:hypothetical protein